MAAVADTYFTVGKVSMKDKSLSSSQQKKTPSSFAICIFMVKTPYYKKHFDI